MMANTIYCLVDAAGHVFTKYGAESYADVLSSSGLNESECQKYRFSLISRQVMVDRGTPSGSIAVHAYLTQNLGTPERLMHFVEEGHVPKDALVDLLGSTGRWSYLQAVAEIEKRYTAECAAENDPCLKSGCSIDQASGEACLQPLLRAGVNYERACAAEWIKSFRNPQNRIEAWKE
jgi:hypothetical protein